MNEIVVFVLACATAVMYRCGGSGNYPRFFRPMGVGIGVLLAGFILFDSNWISFWALLASSGASAGLSTTYFKKKNTDAMWFNWLFVGLALSIALLPMAFATQNWTGFLMRSLVLTSGITLWSQFQGNAVKEELGRGFLIIATLLLMGA
ncbi:hypothetical protein EKI60_06425 [Candidatus Saccharibacteria bacterium]|nr:MAG: hypothetical protein EKI60_06425 [Candidatus Saccharibacteria bacterium]